MYVREYDKADLKNGYVDELQMDFTFLLDDLSQWMVEHMAQSSDLLFKQELKT